MSHKQQQDFVESIKVKYPSKFKNKRILEVGSLDINGSVRKFFECCDYTGIDVGEGKGVDIVCQGQDFRGEDNYYDVVISCECFEHNPFWKETFQNMYRMLKPGGLFIITCATTGRQEHGTSKTTASDSPLTVTIGWDYYKNLEERDFRNNLNLEKDFGIFEFSTNKEVHDIYFYGVKMFEEKNNLSIVCASHDNKILEENLLKSKNINDYELIIKKNYNNVPRAYNDAMKEVTNNIVIFVHHDVRLCDDFFDDLQRALYEIDEDWGILGVAGMKLEDKVGYVFVKNGHWGNRKTNKGVVDTLDELLIIVKKDSIIFDEKIPSAYHMFAVDACMQFKLLGKSCYAIKADTFHNCKEYPTLPKDFHNSAKYLKRKYWKNLPIITTCITIK